MRDITKPTIEGETKAQQTAIKILSRVSIDNSTEKNIFVTAETVKAYGRELLAYVAILAPEAKEVILSIELQ